MKISTKIYKKNIWIFFFFLIVFFIEINKYLQLKCSSHFSNRIFGPYIWREICKRTRCPSIVTLALLLFLTWCISWTDLECTVHLDPSRQKDASIWAYMCSILGVHSNHSLWVSILKFTDLICSVYQDPSCQKVASIWAYMCSILKVHSNHSLRPSIPKYTDLICSVHQDPSRQKVASICLSI